MDKAKDFEKGWKEYKAKRNQEIEELAKVLCVNRKPLKCKDCVIRGMCEFKETAKEVYDAGYRKIPKGVVVLTPAERDEEMRLIREDVIGRMEATRKETAEKFAELLKGTVPQGLIDKILKEFTGDKNAKNE